jgi:hypothetical protein
MLPVGLERRLASAHRFCSAGASGAARGRLVLVSLSVHLQTPAAAPWRWSLPNPQNPMISFGAIVHIVTAISASSTRQDGGLVKIGRNHFAP